MKKQTIDPNRQCPKCGKTENQINSGNLRLFSAHLVQKTTVFCCAKARSKNSLIAYADVRGRLASKAGKLQ